MDFNNLAGWIFVFLLFFGLPGGGWVAYQTHEWLSHRRKLAHMKIQAKLPPPPPPPVVTPDPICGCNHSLAFHPAQGGCVEKIVRPVRWEQREIPKADVKTFAEATLVGVRTADGGKKIATIRYPVEWENDTCTCVRYVGPEPLITLAAPELSQTAIEIGHHPLPPTSPSRPGTGPTQPPVERP